MWERLQRFRALDSEARRTFFRAAVLLPMISLSLRIRGFRATQAALQGFSIPSKTEKRVSAQAMDAGRVQIAVRMVNAAARYGLGSTCLEKSLTLWWLLRRDGIVSSLRTGARKEDSTPLPLFAQNLPELDPALASSNRESRNRESKIHRGARRSRDRPPSA